MNRKGYVSNSIYIFYNLKGFIMIKKDSILIDGKKYLLSDLPKQMVVYGDLNLRGLGLEQLPDLRKWVVHGVFDCSNNKLTSLKGAPQIVGSAFDCSRNYLTSLKGAPSKIVGYFKCSNNKLVSLEGGPKELTGSYDCSCNKLQTLEGAPSTCLRFICSENEDLQNLNYAPAKLYDDLICDESLGGIKGNVSLAFMAKREALLRGKIYVDIVKASKQIDKSYLLNKAKNKALNIKAKTEKAAKKALYSFVDYMRS
jgi:hypothetical protein